MADLQAASDGGMTGDSGGAAGAFDRVGADEDLEHLVCRALAERAVPHGFSLRWRQTGKAPRRPFGLPPTQAADREELTRRMGWAGLATMRQAHANRIEVVSGLPPVAPLCDGLVTDRNGLGVLVQTADCVPLLLWDSARNVVAAVHAGWRGTLARIAAEAVRLLEERFGSRPESLFAAMGPAIGRCCYEVGDEVVEAFERRFPHQDELHFPGPRGKHHLDLPAANRNQLLGAGVPAHQVFSAELCTSCHPEMLYSYRRDGKRAGRLYGVIGVAPPSRA